MIAAESNWFLITKYLYKFITTDPSVFKAMHRGFTFSQSKASAALKLPFK